MTEDDRFLAAYLILADELHLDGEGSLEHKELLAEWHQVGRPADIKTFLFRTAKTAGDLPQLED